MDTHHPKIFFALDQGDFIFAIVMVVGALPHPHRHHWILWRELSEDDGAISVSRAVVMDAIEKHGFWLGRRDGRVPVKETSIDLLKIFVALDPDKILVAIAFNEGLLPGHHRWIFWRELLEGEDDTFSVSRPAVSAEIEDHGYWLGRLYGRVQVVQPS